MLLNLIRNYKPGNAHIRNDLKLMETELRDWKDVIVPWSKENLDLMSYGLIHNEESQGMISTAKGIFTTIYHEPLFGYSYKKYISRGETNAILLARTTKHEFLYRIQGSEIQIHIDKQVLGIFKNLELLYGGKNKRLLGRLNGNKTTSEFLTIVLMDKQLGSVSNPKQTLKHNPRVFEFIRLGLEPREEAVMVALGLLWMIKNSCPNLAIE